MKFLFETDAEVVDIYNGTVAVKGSNGKVTKTDYDIVVACDGAGSTARLAMAEVPGFEQSAPFSCAERPPDPSAMQTQ